MFLPIDPQRPLRSAIEKTLRLSPEVYSSPSLAAIGLACHEAGHALQHASGFAPPALRSALAPPARFGSFGSCIFILLGAFTSMLGGRRND